MDKEMKMQLSATLQSLKRYHAAQPLSVYISELEGGNLTDPQRLFALQKIVDFCQNQDIWKHEQEALEQVIQHIKDTNEKEARKAKEEAPINKFWVSFYEWFHNVLPFANLLYPQYVGYDGWNNGTYYLDIDFNSVFRMYLGINYDNRYEDQNHCTIDNIKLLIELLYNQLIKVEARYEFTIQVNKLLSYFSLPYILKNGRLIKKGYKTSNRDPLIINFQMLESKIHWSEDRILGNEVLDKHTALNYITDALQYVLSLINNLEIQELQGKRMKQRCALIVNNDESSKVYSVVQKEFSEIQTIVNEYFDIRHNEYFSQNLKSEREALNDPLFIEYLYNRIYALLYLLKAKYLQTTSSSSAQKQKN